MIRHLRRRLTLLFALTTGGILIAVLAGLLFFNAGDAQKKLFQAFQGHILTVSSRMQVSSTMPDSWLAQTEADNRLLIHIEENGIPLLYPGSWTPATDRETLVDRARRQALSEHVDTRVKPVSSPVNRSSVFLVDGDSSDSYYACVLVFSTSKGFQSLILLGHKPSVLSSVLKQLPFFLLLGAAGLAALSLASRRLIGRALEPVEQSRNQQTQFIAAASHELRSPLAVIEASASAALAAPDKLEQLLGTIRAECSRMAGLVGDLLLLASADAGTWSVHFSEIDSDTLAIGIFETFEPLCRSQGKKLVLDLPDEALPPVRGDEKRLEQILAILLDNAIHYTPEGGSVTLRVRAKTRSLCLEVSDQGCGFSEETKAHLFERFYKGDASRTDKQHFGLGLSVAKELAELHHGRIEAEGAPGKGACFRVILLLSPHKPG